jgi:hypothetical protein
VEEKAEKTRAELAENSPIGPSAGKAAAVAGAAAVATLAMRCSAAATPAVGAQHAAPATNASAATRPRTEETATKVGAAAEVDPTRHERVAASGGQVELTRPGNWDFMNQAAKKNRRKTRAKHKRNNHS